MKLTLLFATCALLIAFPARSSAQSPIEGANEFSLSMGYANISIGGSSSELNSQGAFKFDPVFSFSPIEPLPQLRIGLSGSVAMVLDNSSRSFSFNNGTTIITGSSEIPFVLFEPEARLSWRQFLGNNGRFFVEPGIGLGGAFGWLTVDSDTPGGESISESAATWSARAFLYIGAQVTGGTAGLELSYMQGGDMDFADNANGDVSEFYIGIFGAIQF